MKANQKTPQRQIPSQFQEKRKLPFLETDHEEGSQVPGELRWRERSGNEHRLNSSQEVKVSPGWHALELGTKASDGPQKQSHHGCAKRDDSSNQITMKKD